MTQEALRASIVKWKKNTLVRKSANRLMGRLECPLCDLYYAKGCRGCVISEATEVSGCASTPYEQAFAVQYPWEGGFAFRAAAKDEVKFLEGLLDD